ncbi:GNAT family N-acetyltransferase, partial [Streptomyces sp. WAC05374]|uniref:GNAT family N-acetyltransferase n=1 Tax=Streptomyces sp. WAC05374 TaxID=2487420 RepID=UPI0037DCCBF5
MPQDDAEVQVRPGVEGDLGALTDIYNHYVRETAITFDTTPFAPEVTLHARPDLHLCVVLWHSALPPGRDRV